METLDGDSDDGAEHEKRSDFAANARDHPVRRTLRVPITRHEGCRYSKTAARETTTTGRRGDNVEGGEERRAGG